MGRALSSQVSKLVALARDGDADAFGELYSIYSKEMYRYACSMVGNPDLAQDAVQDAVMAAFKEIKSLRNADSFKGWLFRILNSACRRQYNLSTENLPLIEEADPGETDSGGIEQADMSMGLNEALEILTREEKEIVMLRAVSEYGSKEIAEALGVPDATIRSKYKRALEKLRKFMAEKEGGGTYEKDE